MNNTNKIPMNQQEIDEMVETMSVMLDSKWIKHSTSALREYVEEWRVSKFDIYQKIGGIIVDVPIKQTGKIEEFYAKYEMYKKAVAVVDRLYPTFMVEQFCAVSKRNVFMHKCGFLKANISFLTLTAEQRNDLILNRFNLSDDIYSFVQEYLLAVKNDLFESNPDSEILKKLHSLDYNIFGRGFVIYPNTEEMYNKWATCPKKGSRSTKEAKKYNDNIKRQIEIIQELHPLIFGTSKSPKLTKAIGQFTTFGKRTEVFVKAVQLLISQLNNEIAVADGSTRLKLSIHPMDFLTQSENDYGWRSCTAMDGEFNTSPFSMILDNCSMIAYAESVKSNLKFFSEQKKTVHHWNNKKWRMLLHWSVNMDAIGINRHYPTEDSVLENNFIAFFMEKWDFIKLDHLDIPEAKGCTKVYFADITSCCDPYVYFDEIYDIIGDKNYIKEAEELADIVDYDFERSNKTLYIDFDIGAETSCLNCGEAVLDYDSDDNAHTLCSSCQNQGIMWNYADDEE